MPPKTTKKLGKELLRDRIRESYGASDPTFSSGVLDEEVLRDLLQAFSLPSYYDTEEPSGDTDGDRRTEREDEEKEDVYDEILKTLDKRWRDRWRGVSMESGEKDERE